MTMAAEVVDPNAMGANQLNDLFEYQMHVGERVNQDGTLHIVAPAASPNIVGPEHQSPLTLSYLKTRYDFVQSMGWLPGAVDDWDRYDENPATLNVMKSNPDNPDQVWAGMRLTRIKSIEESLSWSMLSGDLQEAALEGDNRFTMRGLLKSAQAGKLYDLTRLVANFQDEKGSMPTDRETVNHVFREVFGAGVAASTDEDGVPPTWIFVTNVSFRNHLTRMGIRTEEIVRGRNSPTDNEDSVMSIVCPQTVLDYAAGMPYKVECRDTFNVVTAAANSFTD